MDTFIKIRTPLGRSFRIDGSERECAEYLQQINDSFEARGGIWLAWDVEGTSWVPATSDIEFNYDITEITEFHALVPPSVEVLPD